MCEDHGGSHKDIFYYFKLYNGDLDGRSEYHEICNSKHNPLLAWIPYEQVQKRYASELNPKEVSSGKIISNNLNLIYIFEISVTTI